MAVGRRGGLVRVWAEVELMVGVRWFSVLSVVGWSAQHLAGMNAGADCVRASDASDQLQDDPDGSAGGSPSCR